MKLAIVGGTRRNAIGREDAWFVVAVAGLSGLLAALAGCEPTGLAAPDALLTFALGAFVTWLAASSPWWALFAASVAAAAMSLPGPIVLTLVAVLAVAAAGWIGRTRSNQPAIRAGIGAVVVQVALRLEWEPFFTASALAAGAILVFLAASGFLRRPRYVRKRVLWGLGGMAVLGVLSVGGVAAAAVPARSPATDGYQALLDGLEYLENGDAPAAAASLRDAASQLTDAHGDLTGPLAAGARFVPVVAQNVEGASDVLERAAEASLAAAVTLDVVDLEQLRVVNGVIDVTALAILAEPLADLEVTVAELQGALDDAHSPWLVGPFQDRLDRADDRADQVAHQARATAATARIAPAMLGVDGSRRYLLAFTNPAESRGQNGLMGNWTEVTIDNGRLQVTASGRSAELERGIRENGPLDLNATDEYLARYGLYGAGSPPDTGVHEKFWGNTTMPPDMPSVGNAMAQMYEAATDRPVDGVIVMDPFAIASLLRITGPLTVPGFEGTLNEGNVEQFLVRDQYELAESEREDFLAAVTQQTVDTVLDSSLPAPQTLAAQMSDAALGGHMSAYVMRLEEQELLALVGMEAAMPVTPGRDLIAVTSNNANGNKIDSFLEREIVYRPTHDAETGEIDAELSVTLTNTAPTTGFPDYVIGNLIDLPTGSNRTIVTIYSPQTIGEITVDGQPKDARRQTEFGLYVAEVYVEIPPGGTATLETTMTGTVSPGEYELSYRPQALPTADDLVVEATSPSGKTLWTHEGPLSRRSVISDDGVRAWRP